MSGLRHVRTIVVAHGASEVILCESIKANLRLPMEIISENGGSKCIQINALRNFFSEDNFSKHIEQFSKSHRFQIENNRMLVNTTIFTIMDTDDCKSNTLDCYKNGDLFSESPYSSMIVPIFNSPKLDSVMEEMGFAIDTRQKRKSYERIFPGENGNVEAALKLLDNVTGIKNSNLNIFLEHCVKEARKNSFNKRF